MSEGERGEPGLEHVPPQLHPRGHPEPGGPTGDCLERLTEVQATAQSQGFHQLMYSELGPDVDEALGLLCDEIIPAL